MRRPLAAWLITALSITAPAIADIPLRQADGGVLVLSEPAARIITLAPNLAEMAFAAGVGGSLVATVEFSDYPESARQLPRIGDAFRFDLERIVDLAPDLVIAWDSGNPSAALRRLESLGLRVWRTETRRPADIAVFLEEIAVAAGQPARGIAAAGAVRQRLLELRETHSGKSPVTYFYQVSARPLFTLNGEHLVSQGLALCGGVNIFAGETVLAPQVTREAVLVADPDVLVAPVLPGGEDPLQHWSAWPRLAAIRKGALVHLPADEISRATPRILDSLETACTLFDEFRTKTTGPRL